MEKKEIAKIFISFSFADEVFAQELSKLLRKICQNEKIVYCVAENNNYNAVKYGQDFSEDFMNKVKECIIFIPLLSLNYLSSISSIIELGAALGTEKTILPILLPGTEYKDFNKLYNLRNREFYSIENQIKFKKFLEVIREKFNLTNFNESDLLNFTTIVNKAKEKYRPYILNEKQCKLYCESLSDESAGIKFCDNIVQEKLVDTIVYNKVKKRIQEYHLYMWPGKTVSDLQHYIDKAGYDHYIIEKLV